MIAPITPLVVGNNGAWRAVRASSAQGSCGVHGYPCLHPGVDVVGKAGTTVVAPEDGVIMVAADGSAPPFVGYGPYLVLLRGRSGAYHLLAHLDPAYASMVRMGMQVHAGQPVGRTSSANHTHWEVRKKAVPGAGETNLTNNLDPLAWMRGSSVLVVGILAAGGLYLYYLWKRR